MSVAEKNEGQFPQATTLTTIAGESIPALAREFGTPVYVYDATPIVRRISQLKQFDAIRYAQKACSNLAILDLMRRHGVLVDAVSAGEILRAIAAGYQPGQRSHPPEIVFTADLFDRETLEMVVRHDLHVNCGSPDMIDQYGEALASRAVPGPDVTRGITLRINPGFGHGHSQKTNTGGSQSKHGIWHEQIPDCVARAAKHELTITGLHMHIGSGSDMEHLSQVCGAMEKAALKVGPSLTSVSAGGGLPIDYREGRELADTRRYFDLWNKTRDRLANEFGHPLALEIEPGRFLVAESGFLISEIRAVKTSGENTFYLVDAGFNNLARPILYGAYHPMAICPANAKSEPGRSSGPDGTKRRRRRPLVRIGRRLHAGGRRLRGSSRATRGQRRRLPRHRLRRRVRLRHGQQLQLKAVGGRSADRKRPDPPHPRPTNARRPHARRSDPEMIGQRNHSSEKSA